MSQTEQTDFGHAADRVVLAATAFAGVATVAMTPGFGGPWDMMVGTAMVCLVLASSHLADAGPLELNAHAAVLALSFTIALTWPVDKGIGLAQPHWFHPGSFAAVEVDDEPAADYYVSRKQPGFTGNDETTVPLTDLQVTLVPARLAIEGPSTRDRFFLGLWAGIVIVVRVITGCMTGVWFKRRLAA